MVDFLSVVFFCLSLSLWLLPVNLQSFDKQAFVLCNYLMNEQVFLKGHFVSKEVIELGAGTGPLLSFCHYYA
jgi:hypothetical protein